MSGSGEQDRLAKLKADREEMMRKMKDLEADLAAAALDASDKEGSALTPEEQKSQDSKYLSNAARASVSPLHSEALAPGLFHSAR